MSVDVIERLIPIVRTKLLEENIDTDEEAMKIVESVVLNYEKDLTLNDLEWVISKLFAKTRAKLGVLEEYIKNDEVNEIMVNGKDHLFLESKRGIEHYSGAFDSVEELEDIIRNIAAAVHREINEMNPILDARLADGSRVNAVYRNIAVNGPVLTIRKFAKKRISIQQLIDWGTITRQCAQFLEKLVLCGYNIFVSGGTSSGKTTFLNALSDFIPKKERIIVIEDSTELQLNNIPNLVQMECHNANSQGMGQVSMAMLIKTSLRMRPDRIIVGEVRGKEVSDMLQSLNTGHSGMSTGHGNSVKGMLRRLEAMYLMAAQLPMDAIRAQIVEGIDIMVHLGRFSNQDRKVIEVQELVGFEDNKYLLNPLFILDDKGNLIRTNNELQDMSRMILKGITL